MIQKTAKSTTEKTGPQVLFPDGGLFSGFGYQTKPHTCTEAWWKKVRKMRTEPTIAYLSQKFRADVVRPGFTVMGDENADDEMIDFVREQVEKIYDDMARDAARGCIEYGNAAFEVVYEEKDGQIVFNKFKTLLAEATQILIYSDNGEFAGYLQDLSSYYPSSPSWVMLYETECFHVAYNVEGTNWYGRPIFLNIEQSYDQKQKIETRAEEFDGRVAAAHWAVYYPPGSTEITDTDGNFVEYQDNKAIALEVLQALLSTGSAVIPSEVDRKIAELGDNTEDGKSSWKIELLTSARTSGAPYNERLSYKDTEFARGFGYAERSVFEGKHGTKAEAEAHSEGSLGGPQEVAIAICHALSMQVIPQLMEYNFGPEYRESVYVMANPATDQEKLYLQSLYEKLLGNGEISISEYDAINMFEMGEKLGIPYRPQEEIEAEREDMMEMREEQFEQDENEPEDEPEDEPPEEDGEEIEASECGANAPGGGGFQPGNTCASGGGGESVDQAAERIKKKYALKTFRVYENEEAIELSYIRVPADQQGQGIGGEALKELQEFARKRNKPIILSVESDEGRDDDLVKFYTRHGFEKPGSGQKDYSLTRHTHIWKPENERE